MKLKQVPKSLRESNRYILFECKAAQKVDYNSFANALLEESVRTLGKIKTGKSQILLVREAFLFPRGIIKTNPKNVNAVKAVLSLMQSINQIPCIVRSVRISGQMQKALQE